MTSKMNRRRFLGHSTVLGSGLVILGDSRSARSYQANERVNVAVIGVSGRGSWFSKTMPTISNVVAMCDVNERRAAAYYERVPKARTFRDFRKMLDEMGNEIEAVTVATPDHTHAVAAAAAIRRGKHVLCEKPLAHNVHESRALRELAAKYKVATQMGNQGTASHAFRQSVGLIQAGVLGAIHEVHVWNTGGGQGKRPLPEGEEPVPEWLDWDVWLGPAPFRPFHSEWLKWRGWREFDTGVIGNWACHQVNVAFKALKIDSLWYVDSTADPKPTIRVEAEVSEITDITFPRWAVIRYDVPARGDLLPVRLTWYNGGGAKEMWEGMGVRDRIAELIGRPVDWTDADGDEWKDWAGIVLAGDKGRLYANAHNTTLTLLPRDTFKDFDPEQHALPYSRGHEAEWLAACKGGPPAMSNFDYAGPLAEFILLGNVATQIEGPIDFDPAAMKITNNAKADGLLRREYRKGWAL